MIQNIVVFRFMLVVWFLVIGLAGLSSKADAQGLSPEEAVKRMTLPPGFQANVFASEPDIRQPVATCWDHRGRLWVIEYLQYPVPEGLKPVTMDVYLRTEYDRVPEPPPVGPRGKDRIKILEDTDGDGRADKVTTFMEGLNLASAIAVGYDGVFIGQAPYLLYYADKNHDDRPDGDPEVLLKGFGLQDAHAVVNSLAWGPDGWLYGAQGSTVTARIRGTEFQQGVWRYHVPSKKFELFAEGGGNTWGLDFDRTGQAFGSSNGGFITFHMTQGGYYWKGFSKHGPLHNPFAFGYFDSIAYNGLKKGGHVTPGGIFYRGRAFPEEFQEVFIGGNLLSNAVYWHKLKPKGSTYEGTFGGTLIEANDPWFRAIDLTMGPDDAIYVVDWYDQRASHLDPRDNWDKTNGRVYRISYQGGRTAARYDLTKESADQLVARLTGPSAFFARQAREELLFRQIDDRTAESLKSGLIDTQLAAESRLNLLWVIGSSGRLDDALAMRLLSDPEPTLREWTIRFLGNGQHLTRGLADRLEELAEGEKSAAVRIQLAASCRRWPAGMMLPILDKLTSHDKDLTDTMIPLTLWWTVQDQFVKLPEIFMEWMGGSAVRQRPIVQETIFPRLARMLVAQASEKSFGQLWQFYGKCSDTEKAVIVRELEQGATPAAAAGLTARWRTILDQSSAGAPADSPLFRASLKFGIGTAARRAGELVLDPKTADATRIALIQRLSAGRSDQLGQVVRQLLADERSSGSVTSEVLLAASQVNDPELAQIIMNRYAKWPADLQGKAINMMVNRPESARVLLEKVEKGDIPRQKLTSAHAQAIDRLGDKSLSASLEKVWGRPLRPTSEARIKRIAEIRGILPEGDKGLAVRGKAVFQKNCATCHQLFGDGMALGPELNGADRGNLDFLLTSIIDPSAQVRGEYQAVQVALKDGRVLVGLVADKTDSGMTLIDANRQLARIAVAEIDEVKVSAASLMPEGILDNLKDNEIRDLFRYLQSPSPPK